MEKIRVVFKEVDKDPEIKEIDNDYKVLQEHVGGLIDITPLPGSENIDIICNDEYLYNGSMANVMMPERDNVLCGNVLFAGYNEEDGSTIGLNDNQIKEIMEYIDHNKVFKMDPAMAYYAMQDKKEYDPYTIKKLQEMEM